MLSSSTRSGRHEAKTHDADLSALASLESFAIVAANRDLDALAEADGTRRVLTVLRERVRRHLVRGLSHGVRLKNGRLERFLKRVEDGRRQR